MNIKYTKAGVVEIDVQDGDTINQEDPVGSPISIQLNFANENLQFSFNSVDSLNDISKTLNHTDWSPEFREGFQAFFFTFVVPELAAQFPFLQDLTLTHNE